MEDGSNFLAKRIIPCLDVKDGRVVKGINFEGLIDAGDPVEIASRYNENGADELTFLDITASHERRDTIVHTVQEVAKKVFIPLTVGGGIRTLDDIYKLLNVGCDKVSLNSAAVANPSLINESAYRFGSSTIVVAIDAKSVGDTKWNIFINGGRIDTGIDAVQWAKQVFERGAGELLVTSMDADGTKNGFDIQLTRAIRNAVDIPIIASGGAGKVEHFISLFEAQAADAALAATIFHFQEIEIHKLKSALSYKNIPIRP